MSKYIDMITTQNKTLTVKYDQIKAENEGLLNTIEELRKENYKLKEENYKLQQNQCTEKFICKKFNQEVKNIMQFAQLFNGGY
jgi:predicted nuclease with TOPRIM domain